MLAMSLLPMLVSRVVSPCARRGLKEGLMNELKDRHLLHDEARAIQDTFSKLVGIKCGEGEVLRKD